MSSRPGGQPRSCAAGYCRRIVRRLGATWSARFSAPRGVRPRVDARDGRPYALQLLQEGCDARRERERVLEVRAVAEADRFLEARMCRLVATEELSMFGWQDLVVGPPQKERRWPQRAQVVRPQQVTRPQ